MATLGAEWFAAGFVHGVLNTDNVSITGESFDYGPWRFLDRYDPGFTAAYFDQTGLYAFARQPEALNWNLARLGECLIPLSSRAAIEPPFDSFAERFQAALTRQTFARLGLLPGDDPAAARALMHRFWGAMQETAPAVPAGLPRPARRRPPERLRASPLRPLYETATWAEVIEDLRALAPAPGLADAPAADGARNPRHRRGRGDLVRDRPRRRLGPARREDRARSAPPAPATPPSACSPARTPAPGTSRSPDDQPADSRTPS